MSRILLPLLTALVVGSAAGAQGKILYDESVLRTVEITFKQTNWSTLLASNYAAKKYIKADFKVDGVVYKDVGVRYRGNSSYKAVNSLKKPFKISMDEFVPDQELYGFSTLNFNNGFRDPSFIREVLCFHMFRRFEPAPRANWVVLRVNGQSFGVYISVEQINKDLLGRWFEDDSGLRYRGERGPGGTGDDPAFKWLGWTKSNYLRGYELKNENPVNPWTNLVNTCNILNNTPAGQLHAAAPKIVDIDECIRYLACNNIAPAIDSYIGGTAHNFYLYEDPFHGRTSLLPWDLNATFGGNAWLTILQKQQLSPFYFTTKIYRPLLSRVILDPTWKQRYIAHMRAMLADFYDWKFAGPRATSYQKLIQSEVQKDPIKLYPMTQFAASVTSDLQINVNGRWQWIPGIRPMIEKRRAYLLGRADFNTVAPTTSNLNRTPAIPKDQDTVWINATVRSAVGLDSVTLFWRTIGAYTLAPMFDDGMHHDGAANDGVFGVSIPPRNLGAKVEYYVRTRSTLISGGAMSFLPPTAGHLPPHYRITELSTPSPLGVNEVLADNETVDKDAAGDYDDWAEVHNRSNTAINLAGYFLSDSIKNNKLWKFPSGVTIPAKGFIRLWCDNEPAEGPLHTTFKLAKQGEMLLLSDPTGRTLDILVFGEQKADRSYGRLPDGASDLYYLFTPSGGGPVTGSGVGQTLRFDIRRTGSPLDFDLKSTSIPRVGNILDLQMFGGPANGTAILGVSLGLQTFDLGAFGPLLIDPALMLTIPTKLDAFGFGGFAAKIPNGVAGVTIYIQAAALDLSNALAVRFSL